MTHILEENLIERARWNALTATTARAAWRRAVEATTGALPSWAQRRRKGLRPSFDAAAAVARYRSGGVTLKQVAQEYGVTPQAIGHHVRKTINQPKPIEEST